MKFLGTLALATLLSSTAMADPILSVFPSFAIGPYTGLRTGYSTSKDPVLGANLGYDLGLVRLETDYDRLGFHTTSVNLLTGNAIVQYPLGSLTPYALGGLGYEFRNSPGYFADTANWATGSAVWNVGAGVRYALNDYVDIDGRYRFVQPFKTVDYSHPYQKGDPYHVFTTGLNFRF